MLAAQGTPAWAAPPTPHPIPRACQQALAYERTAASDTVSAQASYDAAIAGLEANKRCNDEPMRLTREAYLLSMRAAAEHALKIPNWQRDLTRANMLLANCSNRPDVSRAVRDDCRTQARYNEEWEKRTVAQPSYAPRSYGSPTPATPRPYGTQPPGPAPHPIIAPPPTPNPSPRP
jgi:hypothetical protein